MKNEDRDERFGAEPQEDDIEILEIVGLDEEGEEITFDEEPAPKPAPAPAVQDGGSEDRERLLRLHADFENLKKRSEKELAEQRRFASVAVVERLLPVIDNFERALAMGTPDDSDHSFRQGVELIWRQLMEELRKEGLTPIESLGQAFDPNLHEAVETCSSSEHQPHTVIEEFLKGYRFQDRLLRPSMVKVSVAPEENSGTEPQTE
jgi:molecular chaperone GrpE